MTEHEAYELGRIEGRHLGTDKEPPADSVIVDWCENPHNNGLDPSFACPSEITTDGELLNAYALGVYDVANEIALAMEEAD